MENDCTCKWYFVYSLLDSLQNGQYFDKLLNNVFFVFIAACPVIAQENDANIVLSTYNISNGTDVLIGCKNFAQRLSGPNNITCVSGSWSDTTKPKCECKL